MANEDENLDGASADGAALDGDEHQTGKVETDLREVVHERLSSIPRRYLVGGSFVLFLLWLALGGGGLEGGPALKCEERYTLENKYGEKPEGQQVIIKYDTGSGSDVEHR